MDDLQTTEGKKVSIIFYRDSCVMSVECGDAIVVRRRVSGCVGGVCSGGGTSKRFPIFCSGACLSPLLYRSGDKRCNLCLEEKMCIMEAEPNKLLNKRSEIISKCRHQNKHRLHNLKHAALPRWHHHIPLTLRKNPNQR